MIPETTSASPDSINMLFRLLLAATILVVAANSQGLMAICMQYCASIQGSILMTTALHGTATKPIKTRLVTTSACITVPLFTRDRA
ncbi:Protein CBG01114 [Caenorhabditis briggsae]|uniref:Protein CBG01114 n=1 Tax=Caenorhabditis briggsae TaxID=6238 RepID=A8WPL1_CAEBR|nr:Protein CBG01114 [Caenorhabditis briggsae]CAP22418.2 Protein CBG01114 [Caenorhabditis briggsae]